MKQWKIEQTQRMERLSKVTADVWNWTCFSLWALGFFFPVLAKEECEGFESGHHGQWEKPSVAAIMSPKDLRRKSLKVAGGFLTASATTVHFNVGLNLPFGLPRWCSGKESVCQCKRCKRCWFDPWVGKMPWSRKWQPTPLFLPGKFHKQRSLVGYSTRGCKASRDWAHTHVCVRAHTRTHTQTHPYHVQ